MNDYMRHSLFAGNIVNASPISDLNPVLLASGATLNLASIGNMPVIITVIIIIIIPYVCRW